MSDRSIRSAEDLAALAFDADGLVPVVAQDVATGRVLMVAWASREALQRTLETGLMHYWSRSRQTLWKKGETSGHLQRVAELRADCDRDTVLARVRAEGPACHTGEPTCFGDVPGVPPGGALGELWTTLEARARDRPEGSYTVRLLDDPNLCVKKLGEEAAELVAALARGGDGAAAEAADLLYHVMAALLAAGRGWDEVEDELARRRRGG